MQVQLPYKNLTHTLRALKIQVIDSIPFMHQYLPTDIYTPRELFTFLKSITRYKSDPKGIELLQSVPTLFDRADFEGKLRGDCDCTTILTLSSIYHLFGNKTPQWVTIVGNKQSSPSHIYSEVWDSEENKIMAMDLTNPTYGMERSYNYKQRLKFCI
jgi:hypothetical protein